MFDSAPGNDSQNKISELRTAIAHAEKREDHEEVVLLEAELRATKKGEKFDRNDFLLKMARKRSRPKHRVLKDMQGLAKRGPYNDRWTYDGVESRKERYYSYEETFRNILSQLKVKNFQELVDKKALEQKKDIKVLDLFGGAYFLDDLSHVSRIVGVRLKDIDADLIEEAYTNSLQGINQGISNSRDSQINSQLISNLVSEPKREIIEGDLYKRKTWNEIRDDDAGHGESGFDVIVCRPQGPFLHSSVPNIETIKDGGIAREEIFIVLLERALEILSQDSGVLFSQIPNLKTSDEILNIFWEQYVEKKQKEGYEFLFGAGASQPESNVFAVTRHALEK